MDFIMFEKSKKQYPTGLRISPDRQNLNAVLFPDSLRKLSRGVILISQILLFDSLPWTSA